MCRTSVVCAESLGEWGEQNQGGVWAQLPSPELRRWDDFPKLSHIEARELDLCTPSRPALRASLSPHGKGT